MRFAQENTSATTKDHATKRVKELSKELEEMEREYHVLNVEQIRDELANG
jgi:NAD-dependent DNA ligase